MAGGQGWGAWVAAGLCLVGGVGCFDAPPEAKARLEQVKAEGAELNEAIDEVGGRLLGGRAVVSLWQEMGWRHRSVSQIACQTASTHVEAMAKHVEKQEQRGRSLRRQKMQARSEAVSAAPSKSADSRSN